MALNDTGQSNLEGPRRLAEPRDDRQARRSCRSAGIGTDRRDGHRQPARAEGGGQRLGNGVRLIYGDNGALTISSDFTAKVPELTIAERQRGRRTPTRPSSRSPARTSTSSTHKTTLRRSSSTSTRRPNSRSDRWAPTGSLCAAPGPSGSPSAAAWPPDAGAGRGSSRQARRRRSTTRTTRSTVRHLDARERRSAD